MEENNNAQAKCSNWHGGSQSAGLVWFLGAVGAAIYYIQQADAFWPGVLGFLKALVWPAFLVYEALKYLSL